MESERKQERFSTLRVCFSKSADLIMVDGTTEQCLFVFNEPFNYAILDRVKGEIRFTGTVYADY